MQLNGGFAISRAILKNSDLLPATPWSNILVNDFWGTPLTHSGSHKSYRPLCVATFRINYYFGGLNPFGYHLVNVLLHSVVCWFVVVLSYTLLHGHLPSLVSGLLFAVHAIHTEAVTGVVGRADVQACLFFILSLLAYIKSPVEVSSNISFVGWRNTRWRWMFLCLVLCIISMLSKEQGITVLGTCAVYEIMVIINSNRKQNPWEILTQTIQKGNALRLLTIIFTGLGLLSFRFSIMGKQAPNFSPSDNPSANSQKFLTRLLTFVYLPVFNFWLLVCPRTLSFDWSMDSIPLVESFLDVRCAIILMFYGFFAILGIRCLSGCIWSVENIVGQAKEEKILKLPLSVMKVKKNLSKNGTRPATNCTNGANFPSSNGASLHKNNNLPLQGPFSVQSKKSFQAAIVALGILVLSFLPASNLFFYVGFVVAERILYIPSLGYCLLVAVGADVIWRTCNQRQKKLFCIILLSVLVLISSRTVIRNWDWQNEETLYRSGIPVNAAKALSNLGNVLSSQKRKREAEDAYRKALSYRSNMADTHYNLGILLAEEKRFSEAVQSYENAIHFRPRLAAAHLNLGIVLSDMGHFEKALKVLRTASTISGHGLKDPKHHDHSIISIKYNLGRILAQLGKMEEAISVYLDAVQTRPPHYEPHSLFNMLGEAYSAAGYQNEAERCYKESLKSKPDHLPVHLTYAKHLNKMGKIAEAEKLFKKAQRLDANDPAAWTHYGQFLFDRKRVTEAASMFAKAMVLAPEDFDIAFTAAGYLREIGKNQQAEDCYKKAAELQPQNPAAHMNLGAMFHMQGKLDEAEKSYVRALQLKPGDKLTEENLTKLRSLRRKKRNATTN
ncbi:protein O-mannosyl-transferase TMTC2-like isoform X2 [Acropora millepora]|uniref:protein O-mannosyl-transferase TMTC2-like isoform X2 n=1 Tax=Acropora millepora TaxID=45264 RepID=UPI001CF58EC2|nr:protein O-mannosyl-transferase TMTC2-like isoform X2 [Acropora millepora]